MITADAQVPKIVMDRSEALIQLLSSQAVKNDLENLEALADSLRSAVSAYAAERRLRRYRTTGAFTDVVDLIKTSTVVQSTSVDPPLSADEVRQLVKVLSDATGERFGSPNELLDWWTNRGGQGGKIINDEAAPLGFRWVSTELSTRIGQLRAEQDAGKKKSHLTAVIREIIKFEQSRQSSPSSSPAELPDDYQVYLDAVHDAIGQTFSTPQDLIVWWNAKGRPFGKFKYDWVSVVGWQWTYAVSEPGQPADAAVPTEAQLPLLESVSQP